jgi:hypothetical protein
MRQLADHRRPASMSREWMADGAAVRPREVIVDG